MKRPFLPLFALSLVALLAAPAVAQDKIIIKFSHVVAPDTPKGKAAAKFEELAKASKDPGSAAKGGDLDWASASTFVKPFADTMVSLKKGQLADKPVQTQFGWHVIRVDDIRAAKLPDYESVKEQLAESLQRKKLGDFQQALKNKAKIK